MNSDNTMTYEQRIAAVISDPASLNLPPVAPIIAMFASQFRPMLPPANSNENLTSYEIIQALEDTCSLTTQEVAVTMVYLGYRLNINSYRGYEWAMTTPE